jgi:ubiquinone biosynthesis protein COQ9
MDRLADPALAAGAPTHESTRKSLVQTALRLARERGGWGKLHLHELARESGMSLDDFSKHFRDKDELADGCFDDADCALRAVHQQPGWQNLPPRERLHRAMMAWFNALTPNRDLTSEMLKYRLRPEHLHLQARGVARISRTVQWIREAAHLPTFGWKRELEEAVLTTIFLATVSMWLLDRTLGNERTEKLLGSLLRGAERGALWFGWGK